MIRTNCQYQILLIVVALSACHPVTWSETRNAKRETPNTFALRTLSGQTAQGPLLAFDTGKAATLDGPGASSFPVAEVLWLRRMDRPLPPPPGSSYLLCGNGDRVPATLVRADDEQVRIRPLPLQPVQDWDLPLTAVRGFWFGAPVQDLAAEVFQWRWERETRRQDCLTLQNGDRFEGLWLGGQEAGFQVRTRERVETLPRSAVASLGFRTDLQRRPPYPPALVVVLTDGTRLSLREAVLSPPRTLAGKTVYDHEVRLPLEAVVSLEPHQERVRYLSDLTPVHYEHRPFLDTSWPYVRNGSILQQWPRLADQVYHHNLAMHSASSITFALPENCRTFESRVGLDDRSGRAGSVRVQVLLDGEKRYGSPELTGLDAPVEIRLEVQGGRQLTLRVEFGQRGDAADHVNWAEARLMMTR